MAPARSSGRPPHPRRGGGVILHPTNRGVACTSAGVVDCASHGLQRRGGAAARRGAPRAAPAAAQLAQQSRQAVAAAPGLRALRCAGLPRGVRRAGGHERALVASTESRACQPLAGTATEDGARRLSRDRGGCCRLVGVGSRAVAPGVGGIGGPNPYGLRTVIEREGIMGPVLWVLWASVYAVRSVWHTFIRAL